MFLKSTLYSHWPLWLGGSHCPLVDATFGKFSVGGKAGVEHLGLMRSAYFVLVVLIPKPITSVSKITKVINSWLPILYYYIPDLFLQPKDCCFTKGSARDLDNDRGQRPLHKWSPVWPSTMIQSVHSLRLMWPFALLLHPVVGPWLQKMCPSAFLASHLFQKWFAARQSDASQCCQSDNLEVIECDRVSMPVLYKVPLRAIASQCWLSTDDEKVNLEEICVLWVRYCFLYYSCTSCTQGYVS